MAHEGRLAARVGWLGAAIGPPCAVMATWWHVVSAHVLLSATLVVVYEGIFAMGTYAANIVGELGKRWQSGIVDHVDHMVRRWISPFDRVYRDFLLRDLRRVDVKALTTVGPYTPELDEVFVDVSLDRRAPHQVPADLLAGEPSPVRETERRSIWEFVDLATPAVLAVVGGPGSGKTTLLRHTARQVCRAHRRRRRKVPVLLYLRDHVAAINGSPSATLPEILRGTLGRFAAEEPPGWFEQQLDNGACLVLLDGLDEVGRQDSRTGVAEWVERQARMYPKNDFVITSRPRGYHNSRIDDATVLRVRPFSHEQVTRFVHGWYLAVERERAGSDGAEVRSRAATAADELLDRLLRIPALNELTLNPLLLTMITNVHRERGELPGSRVELYREICEVILWRRQKAKKIDVELGGDMKEAVLRALAFAMMHRRVRDLPHAEVLAVVESVLRDVSSADPTAEDFLADVTSNGLLVERERNVIAFAHHSFQEYLAAVHISDRRLVRVLVEAVDDDWWHLTTLLYAAHADASPIVRACLESASVGALALAFDCAEQSEDFDPTLRDHLRGLLHSAFDPGTDAERRDLMTRALVARHLRELVRAGETGGVVASPITVGIYRLFLQYAHAHHPDGEGLGASDEEPVVGVSAGDALALVGWINELTDSARTYRLPTSTEINDPAVRRTLTTRFPDAARLSVWLEPDHPGARPRLWAQSLQQLYTVDVPLIAGQLVDDIKPAATPSMAQLRMIRAVAIFCGRACARDLAPAIDAVRELVREFTRDVEAVRDADSAAVRSRRRDSALKRLRDLAERLGRVADLTSDLGSALGGVRDLDPLRGLALELGNDRALWRHRTVLPEFTDRTDDHTDVVDRGLRFARGLMLDLDRYHARSQTIALHDGLDAALSTAFASAFNLLDSGMVDSETGVKLRSSDFLTSLHRQFVSRTCDTTAARAYTVPPDMLADTVREGCAALAALLALSESPLPSWIGALAASFEEIAPQVAVGDVPPTADRVAAIRIASLCIAAEVDVFVAGRKVADMFRRIAAGITLVELRGSGQSPVTETVFLALS